MRKRFGKDPARRSSREDLEREAAEELSRATGGSRPPQASWGAAPSRGEPSRSDHLRPVAPASTAAGAGADAGAFLPDSSDDLTAEEEEELITEMALHDLAERGGRSPEDFAISRVDPSAVAAARDRALQEILERQARLQREARAKRKPRPGTGSPLEQMAQPVGSSSSGKAFTPLSVSMMPASGMATQGIAGGEQPRRVPRDSALRKRAPQPEQGEPAAPPVDATRAARATVAKARARRRSAAATPPAGDPDGAAPARSRAGAPAARKANPATATAAKATPAARRAEATPAKENPPKRTRAKAAPTASAKIAPARAAKATTRKPTAAKPTAAKPTAAKPTAAKPTAAKPTAAKPTAAKPTAAKPTAAKPTAAKPTAAKPTAAKPTAAKPTAAKPTAAKRPRQ